jgi:ribosome-associated heat shock protein Hsp15
VRSRCTDAPCNGNWPNGRSRNETNRHRRRVRLDKWLWAARFFKHRSLATEAVDGGKVQLNGIRVKPAKDVKIGDRVDIQIADSHFTVIVRASPRSAAAPPSPRAV